MIGRISGTVLEKQAPWLLLDVSGIGYELEAPLSLFYELPDVGSQVSIYTHFVVREDAQLLFGFASKTQRDVFRVLIKISGVGPKVALAVLSTLSLEEIATCAANQDVATLTKVPGIGQKTALRMLVELQDRLAQGNTQLEAVAPAGNAVGDAISALTQLGYKSAEATKVVRGLEPGLSSEEIIRKALRILSGNVL